MKAEKKEYLNNLLKKPHAKDILREFCPLARHTYGVNVSGFINYLSKKMRIEHGYISKFLREIEIGEYSEKNSEGRLILTDKGRQYLKF
jgi:hypothetical protein